MNGASPRITPKSRLSREQRNMLRTTVPPNGDELNIFRTMARHPLLLERFCAFTQLLRNDGKVPIREREIVILRVGWRTQSVYEFGQHTIVARRAGLSDQEIARITGASDDRAWATGDQLLIQLVDEIHDSDAISDATWNDLADSWNEAQLEELVMLVGLYHMTAWFLIGLKIQQEPGLPGWPSGPAAQADSGN